MSSPELRPRFDTHVPRPLDQTSGQHDAHIIPKGLPGEGNLLVFDNNAPSGYPLYETSHVLWLKNLRD